jgi:hypothetical protein
MKPRWGVGWRYYGLNQFDPQVLFMLCEVADTGGIHDSPGGYGGFESLLRKRYNETEPKH